MNKMILVLMALGLSSTVSYAASATLWDCEGGSVEGLSIYQTHGKTFGSVSWDCFPGDGICNQKTSVTESSENGDTVYEGKGFKLVVESARATDPGYVKAYIKATDLTDANDEGRGLTLDQSIECTKKAQ